MAILQIQHRCPHCRELKDFSLSQISEVTYVDASKRAPPLWEYEGRTNKRVSTTHGAQFCALARCPHCFNPTMFVIETTYAQAKAALTQSVTPHGSGERVIYNSTVLKTYPEVAPLTPHKAWPPEIAESFNEVRKMAREKGREAFAVSGCRSVLDVVTRKLGADKGTLEKRIDKLREGGVITEALQNAAHELRLDGNTAVHEIKVDDTASVHRFVAFLELLLQLAYELPQDIDSRLKPLKS